MKFSVVIPACDRPVMLQECLKRVMRQGVMDYEVIVSDDSLADGSREVARGARWVRGPRRGPAANRNFGASHATGEWLVFLDDDCMPEEGWLAAYEAAATADADVLEGRTECPHPDVFAFYEIVENLSGGALWSCNFAVRREQFEAMRGFDEDFTRPCGEDMEFAWRLRQRKLKSVFVANALVSHPARPMSMAGLIRRTAAHRWIILYRLKTGLAPGLACAPLRAAVDLAIREVVDTVRMFFQLWRPGGKARIKGESLNLIWRCLSLMPFLPYYIYWDLQFRRMLAARR